MCTYMDFYAEKKNYSHHALRFYSVWRIYENKMWQNATGLWRVENKLFGGHAIRARGFEWSGMHTTVCDRTCRDRERILSSQTVVHRSRAGSQKKTDQPDLLRRSFVFPTPALICTGCSVKKTLGATPLNLRSPFDFTWVICVTVRVLPRVHGKRSRDFIDGSIANMAESQNWSILSWVVENYVDHQKAVQIKPTTSWRKCDGRLNESKQIHSRKQTIVPLSPMHVRSALRWQKRRADRPKIDYRDWQMHTRIQITCYYCSTWWSWV